MPITEVPSQYPGLFLFTSPARMVRPVYNLAAARRELIGSFEQVGGHTLFLTTLVSIYVPVPKLPCLSYFYVFSLLVVFQKSYFVFMCVSV